MNLVNGNKKIWYPGIFPDHDTYNILPVNKPANFKHTLDHLAREWCDSLTFPIAWNDLQQIQSILLYSGKVY